MFKEHFIKICRFEKISLLSVR